MPKVKSDRLESAYFRLLRRFPSMRWLAKTLPFRSADVCGVAAWPVLKNDRYGPISACHYRQQ